LFRRSWATGGSSGHRRYLVFNQAARATAWTVLLSFAVAVLPLFTWPGAPRRAIRTSTSPSKPLRPQFSKNRHVTPVLSLRRR
jgi:hypothetical protein